MFYFPLISNVRSSQLSRLLTSASYVLHFHFHIDKDAYILKFYTVIYYEPIVTHFCDLSSGSNTIKLEIQ